MPAGAMMRTMDDIVAEYTIIGTPAEFWLNLGALLTDEVVIVEAQAAGMDWPDLAEGRKRLINTRRVIIGTAQKQGWIGTQESWLLMGADPQEVLAAARPWIEREQQRQLGETETPEGR
jgi:hypothetical protein